MPCEHEKSQKNTSSQFTDNSNAQTWTKFNSRNRQKHHRRSLLNDSVEIHSLITFHETCAQLSRFGPQIKPSRNARRSPGWTFDRRLIAKKSFVVCFRSGKFSRLLSVYSCRSANPGPSWNQQDSPSLPFTDYYGQDRLIRPQSGSLRRVARLIIYFPSNGQYAVLVQDSKGTDNRSESVFGFRWFIDENRTNQLFMN